MIVSSHQPHYFPWLGYFDKIAKSEIFLLNDEVQFEERSPMRRNKFLDSNGNEVYLTLSIEKDKICDKKNREVKINHKTDCINKHKIFLLYNYKKAPYFNEIWNEIEFIFYKNYEYAIEIQMDTMETIMNILDIKTLVIKHSMLNYDSTKKKSELLIEKCKAIGSNLYLSGIGAKKYMDVKLFNDNGIQVVYQDFSYPLYKQFNSKHYIPNLSALDFLFNCGIDMSRKIFWENVYKTKEFENKIL